MTRIRGAARPGLALLAVLVAAPLAGQDPSADGPREPRTIVVEMVDRGPTQFVFEPADIEVRPGDRVVWVQRGVMPHNVEFTAGPGDYDVKGLPMSPFLTVKGQRYELRIDDRFEAGRYAYVCTPHAAMGMRGTLTVAR